MSWSYAGLVVGFYFVLRKNVVRAFRLMKLAYSAVLALIISCNVYTVVLILEVSMELEEPFIVENGIVDSECTSNIL